MENTETWKNKPSGQRDWLWRRMAGAPSRMRKAFDLIQYACSKGDQHLWTAGCLIRNQETSSARASSQNRSQWFIQGHIGSTWKDEQYYRTRDMKYVRPAFEDLLKRLQTDYIDLGMIHYVDSEEEWEQIQHIRLSWTM